MDYYLPIIINFVLGLLVFILQINLTGKGNLAPSTALDAVQNMYLVELLEEKYTMKISLFYSLLWF